MAHTLSPAQLESFGRELDTLRAEVMADRGARDRRYILGLIRAQRLLSLFGRLSMLGAAISYALLGGTTVWPAVSALAVGALLLGLGKILENMEIGHNVMHAQWDWMGDPEIQASRWEWDNVCPSDQWKHSHNVVHHTWTNVVGRDPDVGYGVLRVTSEQPWRVGYLLQPLWHVLLMLLFEWGVAVHDLEPEKLMSGEKSLASVAPMVRRIVWKAARQLLKDFVLWPALAALLAFVAALAVGSAGPLLPVVAFVAVAVANAVANVLRNVWSNIIIFCGHFPAGVHHFSEADVLQETRGGWYVRQLLGSCNIGGGRLFHILSGNLSHQIEHHLFPDMPSNRYPEIAPRVRALATRYGLPYNTGSLTRQLGTTTLTIWRLALPFGGAPRAPERALV